MRHGRIFALQRCDILQNGCLKAETLNPSEHIEQTKRGQTKKAKLHYLKSRSKKDKTDHQVHLSMSIHIFALVACYAAAVRTVFF